MPNTLNEDAIEEFAIKLFERQGYIHFHNLSIAPKSNTPLRSSFDEVILKPKLKEAIDRINPQVPATAREDALRQVLSIASSALMSANEEFHRMLSQGIQVSYQKDGAERGELVWLIDFDKSDENEFSVVNQFTIRENNHHRRPDLVLFVNGLPLVVFELKNPINEQAGLDSAYRQLQTYKEQIPTLFVYNCILVISDGLEAAAGTVSSDKSRFMRWRSIDGKTEVPSYIGELETFIKGMLNRDTLLDLIQHFIVFEQSSYTDAKTKQTTVKRIKKLAGYHQYYAVNKALQSVQAAAKEDGNRKGGVVWHTQGSGKSLTMMFTAGKLIRSLNNPTILVITDRNDLDIQLFDTFAASEQLLRQAPKQATDRAHLKKLIKVASGGVVFTTIQKFQVDDGNVYEKLSDRRNIVVIVDEAHRTQYGFKAKTVDDKDKDGNVIGTKTVYGFAQYMRNALPEATYLGFTGTPIEGSDKNTPAVFGDYVDIYDIAHALEDKATVKIYYESRLAKVGLSDEGKELIKKLDDDLAEYDLSEKQKEKAEATRLEAIIGSEERIKQIAQDIVSHFEQRQATFDGKAMIVAASRRIAVLLYKEIIALRPSWHSDDLDKGMLKVVITSSASDGPDMAAHHSTKPQREMLARRMKTPQDELKIALVCDMWLTGFDVPNMSTLYMDKPMKGHGLMQAIARVNRVYKDKPGGLVVDYLGIAADLKRALSFYSDNGGKGDPLTLQEEAVNILSSKIDIIVSMFHGYDYTRYFDSSTPTSERLSIILAATEHILGLNDGKKRFINEVMALSQAYAIAIPHEAAGAVSEKVAFFQAIKARLTKFNRSPSSKTDEEMETAIKQVVSQAIASGEVLDIFDAAGIKKPDISILSEDFLLEIKGMKHKNLALEVLEKLLKDEIKSRTKINLVQSRSLMEMLETSIKNYHNRMITAIEAIDELIQLAKDIREGDREHKEMGLTEFEYAFYTAVADNDSAKELMQQDTLRELAVVLTESIRKNATIDWAMKESVRASLRTTVKRILRKFGYPPDMQELATQTVLEQTELMAEELHSE